MTQKTIAPHKIRTTIRKENLQIEKDVPVFPFKIRDTLQSIAMKAFTYVYFLVSDEVCEPSLIKTSPHLSFQKFVSFAREFSSFGHIVFCFV